MESKELKKQWANLIKQVEQAENGTLTFDFQDKVPIKIVSLESKKRDIDLTKEM